MYLERFSRVQSFLRYRLLVIVRNSPRPLFLQLRVLFSLLSTSSFIVSENPSVGNPVFQSSLRKCSNSRQFSVTSFRYSFNVTFRVPCNSFAFFQVLLFTLYVYYLNAASSKLTSFFSFFFFFKKKKRLEPQRVDKIHRLGLIHTSTNSNKTRHYRKKIREFF